MTERNGNSYGWRGTCAIEWKKERGVALPTYRQVHDHVAPQVQGPESREIAHPRRQVGDFVAAGVEFGQRRHPAQFVRQGCQSVVSDQQRLQR